MESSTKTIAIILMLAASTLAAGACTANKCSKCEANAGATLKYCTQCHNEPLFGATTNRLCSGGTAVTGCQVYNTNAAGDNYCSACLCTYSLKTAANTKDNTCIKLIRDCNTATVEGQCTLCRPGYSIEGNLCVANAVPNCKIGVVNDKTKCEACNDFYGLTGIGGCAGNVGNPNCLIGKLDAPTKCTFCADGYALMTSELCTFLAAANTNCKNGLANDAAKCSVC